MLRRYIPYFILMLGLILMIYNLLEDSDNTWIQSAGLILLMLGLFLITSKIPSKQNSDQLIDHSENFNQKNDEDRG